MALKKVTNAPDTGKSTIPTTPYTETNRTWINIETVHDAIIAWWELSDTLAFLADVAGHRANQRGIIDNEEDIPLSSSSSNYGENYVRAAALARCRALANTIDPESIIAMYAEEAKVKQ